MKAPPQAWPAGTEIAAPEALPGRWAFEPLRTWRERLFAARYCRRLRRLFVEAQARHPALEGEALYAEVVLLDLAATAERAGQIIGLAEESYAAWPSPQPLKFRHVVRYLVVAKLAERHGQAGEAIGRTVNCRVPSDW